MVDTTLPVVIVCHLWSVSGSWQVPGAIPPMPGWLSH